MRNWKSRMCADCVEWNKTLDYKSNCNLCHGDLKRVERDGKVRYVGGWCPVGCVRIDNERSELHSEEVC